MTSEINEILEISKECKYNTRQFSRKLMKYNGLEKMAHEYNYCVYEYFMKNFNSNVCINKGKNYTTDKGDGIICSINSLVIKFK